MDWPLRAGTSQASRSTESTWFHGIEKANATIHSGVMTETMTLHGTEYYRRCGGARVRRTGQMAGDERCRQCSEPSHSAGVRPVSQPTGARNPTQSEMAHLRHPNDTAAESSPRFLPPSPVTIHASVHGQTAEGATRTNRDDSVGLGVETFPAVQRHAAPAGGHSIGGHCCQAQLCAALKQIVSALLEKDACSGKCPGR